MMKNLKYIIIFILSVGMLNSCDLFDKETVLDLNAEGLNVVTFERIDMPITAIADGTEYLFKLKIKVVGPTVADLTSDITVSLTANDLSTAVVDDMYRIETPSITLSKSNNYLGYVEFSLVTLGNEPPEEGSAEADAYVTPMVYLDIDASGDASVVGSGKGGSLTLNFSEYNKYAGIYDVEMRYFHPTAGGSHPSLPDFDSEDPYGGVRFYQKEFIAVTKRRIETEFSVWADLCWITINDDGELLKCCGISPYHPENRIGHILDYKTAEEILDSIKYAAEYNKRRGSGIFRNTFNDNL